MSISLDAISNSGVLASVSSATWSHTVGSLTNGILVVASAVRDNAATTNYAITGITFNGSTLTKIRADSQTGAPLNERSELWYLVAPASGAHNVVVTFTGTVPFVTAGAISLAGVDQASPIDSQNGANGADSTDAYPLSTTTVADNAWLVDSLYSTTNGLPLIVGGGQTTVFNLTPNSNGDGSGASYKGPVTPAGSTQVTWTETAPAGSLDGWAHSVVSLKPAAGGGGSVGNPFFYRTLAGFGSAA